METPEQCVNYVQSYQDFKHYFDVSIYFEHVNAGWVLAIGLNVLVPLKRFIIYKYDRHFLWLKLGFLYGRNKIYGYVFAQILEKNFFFS